MSGRRSDVRHGDMAKLRSRRAVFSDAQIRALAAARRRGPHPLIAWLECYCDCSQCPTREVTIVLKELDGVTPVPLLCPACRFPLKIHSVEARNDSPESEIVVLTGRKRPSYWS